MKILFFTKSLNPDYCSYLSMLYDLRNYADIKFYGPGWPNSDYQMKDYIAKKPIDVIEVIEKLYPKDYPDAVMQMGPSSHGLWKDLGGGVVSILENFQLAKCLRILVMEDLHNDVSCPGCHRLLKDGEVDLALKMYDCEDVTKYSRMLNETGVSVEWYPFSIDPKRFYDRKLPKVYDVTNIGQRTTQNYPIRYKMHEVLGDQNEIKYLAVGQPAHSYVVTSQEYEFARYNRKTSIRGDEYAEVINQSKIFATDCSTLHFAIQKMFEAMACNTLLLCNVPIDASALGFKPGYNFAEIDDYPKQASEVNAEKFMGPIRYYMKNEDELAKIAKRGYDLVHSRHTHEIRNKDIVNKISQYI